MIIECKAINNAISICRGLGIDVQDASAGWSNAKVVVDMEGKLSAEMKEQIQKAEPDLEYWSYNGSPHNQPDEGFKCQRCGAVISFKK